MLTDEIKKHKSYVIYGAQVVAVGAREAISHLTGIQPDCFAVGKPAGRTWFPAGNPAEIDGIPVVNIETIPPDTFIVLGVTELIQQEVIPYLESHGYRNYYPLTQHEEHLLMSEYYRSLGIFPTVDSAAADADANGSGNKADFTLYEVKNDKDKLLGEHPELFYYEKEIQAGAALTEASIADIRDDKGKNISSKNRMYCEMSAVYWVWKNTDHDWIGIEHYRRHLLVKPEMLTDDIDVIMPLPYICYPNEMAQFLRFTSENVKDALFRALKSLHPEKFEDYKKILYGKYQYTYNLVCAKKHVFDDYCRWFFEITEYMEKEYSEELPELIETRAFSYVAEVLTNLYFIYHQKDLRIRHVEKAIYT
ncbi:MAG: DUF4422 domain-containing protein [Lachnospiraceae bacterium]|nr:DUF4422 domain-containing protein [Lachnospiraceae bacterium]